MSHCLIKYYTHLSNTVSNCLPLLWFLAYCLTSSTTAFNVLIFSWTYLICCSWHALKSNLNNYIVFSKTYVWSAFSVLHCHFFASFNNFLLVLHLLFECTDFITLLFFQLPQVSCENLPYFCVCSFPTWWKITSC